MPVSNSVRPFLKTIAALLGVLLAIAIPIASAKQLPGGGPYPAATHITHVRADLADVVHGDGAPFAWRFEYGTSTEYGSATEPVPDPGSKSDKAVGTTVKGLEPSTTYHARLVWEVRGNTERGGDITFTTAPAEGVPTATDLLAGSDPPAGILDGAVPPPPARPRLGASAVAGVASGAVRVRIPGWERSAPLPADARVPIGSVLDTRAGTLRLTTALADGTTQTASFRGGIFEVRQSPRLGGLTDIFLRRPAPGACAASAPSAGARAAAVQRRRPRELGRLWSHDRGGRYRTHGANSVATVRGTTWVTVELCDATVTRVTAGAVSVFDRRLGRRVLVRAGHSYRARKG